MVEHTTRDLGDLGVIGRDAERRLIAQFLDGPPRVAALVLTGDAGIGKTALWEWSLRHATDAGHTILVSRAGIAEARLPWVGLTDVIAGVPAEILSALPGPQRSALQVVTLQAVADETPDERTVGTALWSVLAAMVDIAPVTIAIDDLPYVDTASTAALRFALRRVGPTAPVRLIATVRGDDLGLAPIDGLSPDRVTSVGVGPLSIGATFELLVERLGVRLTRPVLLRVHETAGGNPLYALELARAMDRLEIVPAPGVPLPVPNGLNALVAERVGSLPTNVLEIAAGTAAAWRFTDDGLDQDGLARALSAGLVVVDDATDGDGHRIIRPVHPLISAAAYSALPVTSRQRLHQRLADRTTDPVEFARHTALAAVRPGPEVARVLDVGVAAALAAGTPDIAADLARLALELTVAAPERAERLDTLADALFRIGDPSGAVDVQREAVDLTPPGSARARRYILLSVVLVDVYGTGVAVEAMEAALADAADDQAMTAEVLLNLAALTYDIVKMDEIASRAVALLERLEDPDPVMLSGALAQAAGARFRAGRGLDHDGFQRAIDIEKQHPARRLSDRADASYAALLKYADDLEGAEARLTELMAEAQASGDMSSIAYVASHLPQISLWRGDIAVAQRLAEQHLEAAEQGRLALSRAQAQFNLGVVLTYRGRLDEAERLLVSSGTSFVVSEIWDRQRSHGALGFLALSRGDAVTAAGHLDEWHGLLTAMHFREPGYSRSHLDYISALVATGRLVDAHRFLDYLDSVVATSGRASAATIANSGRALLGAAEGHLPEAQDLIARSLQWYETSPFRIDRARTLLIAGRIHRRAKAKSLARDALVEAHRDFVAMGADAWAEHAMAELARVNLRPSAPTTLTETERRVAELVASGLTNREVAQQLFLAVKTVESNLARAYRKLGIRSRAELGSRLGVTPPS